MNILTGCLAATSGTVTIGGYDIFEQAQEAKRLIGYLPEVPPLYTDRTPWEYLNFVARAKKVPAEQIPEQVRRVMNLTGVTDVADRLIRNLSKGYRQRVGIAQALLGDPEIIILDEPTVGLDPRQITEIRDLIKLLGRDHTVILSSHILSEVQAVCDTVMIISRGKLVACDATENLESRFAGGTAVELETEAAADEITAILGGVADVKGFTTRPGENGTTLLRLETDTDGREMCRRLFFAFSRAGKAILTMNTARASLEDIFLELTGDEHKEATD